MKPSTSRLRASLFVAVLLWAGGARALSPAQGMELLLTDLGARGLVGYGLLFGDALTVRLSVQEASMQAVVAFVDGEVRLLHGELLDDRLWLYRRARGGWTWPRCWRPARWRCGCCTTAVARSS